tara:strand:- start:800 stop:988 length:189 start_codon:yes stop_codon:yes gene_type:complete
MASKLWNLANDDSRAPFFRTQYIVENGGEWINTFRGWQHRPDKPKVIKINKMNIFKKKKKTI